MDHLDPGSSRDESEIDGLKACLNNLVALIALRSVWSGAQRERITEILADVLMDMLRCDFILVRIFDEGTHASIDTWRFRAGHDQCHRCPSILSFFDAWMGSASEQGLVSTRTRIDGIALSLAAHHLGMRGEFGVILAGSETRSFPSASDRLLLNVAAAQGFIALQEHHCLTQEKTRASDLEMLVRKRTHQLQVATDELQRSETLLAHGQRVSLTGSFVWCPTSRRMRWSEQTFRMLGFDPASGPVPSELVARTHEEDREILENCLFHEAQGIEQIDVVFRYRATDEAERSFHLIADAGMDSEGNPEFVGAIRDVTERCRAEALARDAQQRLLILREELAHANRLASVGHLSAAISHDVRQPLSSLIASGRAGINFLSATPPNIVDAQRAFDRVLAGGQRAGEILDRIKGYAQKEAMRCELAINGLVRDTVSLVSADARQRKIAISLSLESDLPQIKADRVKVQQVMMNLILNAMDALDTVVTKEKIIQIRSRLGEGRIHIEVIDNGPGVPEEARDRIFEAFHTTKQGGLGMGLAICRTIADEHGGGLDLVTTGVDGTKFCFTLPLTDNGNSVRGFA